jgi:O-antigen/teichoic acid export membrane protein
VRHVHRMGFPGMLKAAAAKSPEALGKTRTIASNSLWYGIELILGVAATLATSIPMARVIGPEQLGYFNYVQWLTNLSGLIGMLGIPAATRKFMAEFLGAGEPGIARAVYFATLKLQIAIASVITGLGLVVVLTFAKPEYPWITAFLVLSLWPSMVGSIPSQANVAAQRMAFNTAGSVASYAVNIAAVAISLLAGWDLLGISIGILAYRLVDCGIRLLLVRRWLGQVASTSLPSDLKRRMTTFSGYNLALMLLNAIVWDRSDVVFLRILGNDTAQIAFFSVALGLIDRIQAIPTAFGSAANASILAQYGRDRTQLPKLASSALWYSFACSLPLLVGMAAMSPQLIPALYGSQYLPAVPVLAVVALFAIPKSLAYPAWSLMEAEARQGFLVFWLVICAIVNVLLDLLLIPNLGAMGAAIANGSAQALLPLGLIWRTHSLFGLDFRWTGVLRLLVSAGVMGAIVLAISANFSQWWAMPIEVGVGAAVFALTMRFTGTLRREDRERLLLLEPALPASLRASFARAVTFLAPANPQEASGA